VAILDLRPVHARGQTDTGELEHAAALTQQLRKELRDQGVAVLSAPSLEQALGTSAKATTFACREQPRCLQQRLFRLRHQGIRWALAGTYARSGGKIQLMLLSLAPARVTGRLVLSEAELRAAPEKVASWVRGLPSSAAAASPPAANPTQEPSSPSVPQAPSGATGAPGAPSTPAQESPSEESASREHPAQVPSPDAGPAAPGAGATRPTASDSEGDRVETLVEEDQAAKATDTGAPERFSLTGWALSRLDLGLAQAPYTVPYESVTSTEQLLMRARYARGRSFEASLEGFIGYGLFENQAPLVWGRTEGTFWRGALQTQVRDAYLAFFLPHVELYLGQQRVAWGKGDVLTPNDVLNAHDLRSPFLNEPELNHLATPMVRADIDLSGATLQLVYEPFFIPDQVNVYGTNWALIQPGAAAPVAQLGNLVYMLTDYRGYDASQTYIQYVNAPALNLASEEVGARLGGTAGKFDLNAYYQYGYDSTPVYNVPQGLLAQIAAINPYTAPPAVLGTLAQGLLTGPNPLNATYLLRHHLGFDAVTTQGTLVLRIDAAFDSQRGFLTPSFSGVSSPTTEVVVGLEYQPGEWGRSLLIEVGELHLFNAPSGPLLFYTADTLRASAVFRWQFWNTLETELRVSGSLAPSSLVVHPQLGYRFEPFVLQVGFLWLGGDDLGVGGYFRRNRTVYGQLKYQF
jgi:hypothetical protein